jgi:lipopolysaccharide transport system ATP-binding protein
MIVRLGFAIAAHLEPEILVVDEVLAVGDAEFQKKAIGKMQDVSQGEGRTVLFVSHNMGAVKNLCKRGVLLEQGKVKRIGPVNDVVDEYINQNQGIFEFTKYKDRSGNGTIKINSVEYFNSNNEKINTLKTGEEVIICVNYEIIQNMDHVMESYIDIGFNNLNGSRVAWISSRIFQKKLDPNLKSIKFKIPHLMLDQGSYTINIHCETNIARADWLKNVGNFDVVFDNYFGTNKTIPNNQGSVVLDFQLIK